MIQRGRGTMYTSMLHVRYRVHRQASLSASEAKQLHSYLELQSFQHFPENKHVYHAWSQSL